MMEWDYTQSNYKFIGTTLLKIYSIILYDKRRRNNNKGTF